MATVLLIDDQQSLRMLVKASLEGAGYHVLTADNGKHGLQILEQEHVDVVVTDIFMPEMDGLELILRIRRMHRGNRIIAMSGEGSSLDIGKYLGADDTITKPFSVEDLLTTVASQLSYKGVKQAVQ